MATRRRSTNSALSAVDYGRVFGWSAVDDGDARIALIAARLVHLLALGIERTDEAPGIETTDLQLLVAATAYSEHLTSRAVPNGT